MPIATTRIISMHVQQGKTLTACLTARTDYATNPEKTEKGELISSYECDPKTVDAEFLLSKRQYKAFTGRSQQSDVIAYQIRQSFKPGEITPEGANKLGYELAERFLKGRHAFIVATHLDRKHIHNHIIFNSTTLDCRHKFKDFLGSGRAVARLSDEICLEHDLSVIENPRRYTHGTYDKWLGGTATPSNRELLRSEIDAALEKRPASFDEFVAFMRQAGYEVKTGAHTTFKRDGKQGIRLRSLGDGYSEDDIRAIIAGTKPHTPCKKRALTPQKTSLLIDIQKKLSEGKGVGYQRWATVFNLKQMAQTVLYLQEHDLTDYAALAEKTQAAVTHFNALSDKIKSSESRMAEIAALKTHIINYSKTREVYAGYKASGYSKKYLAAHEQDIALHKAAKAATAAKAAFDSLHTTKLPTIKSLQDEYAALLDEKKAAYADYRDARTEMRELLIHKQNIDRILATDAPAQESDRVRKEDKERGNAR